MTKTCSPLQNPPPQFNAVHCRKSRRRQELGCTRGQRVDARVVGKAAQVVGCAGGEGLAAGLLVENLTVSQQQTLPPTTPDAR